MGETPLLEKKTIILPGEGLNSSYYSSSEEQIKARQRLRLKQELMNSPHITTIKLNMLDLTEEIDESEESLLDILLSHSELTKLVIKCDIVDSTIDNVLCDIFAKAQYIKRIKISFEDFDHDHLSYIGLPRFIDNCPPPFLLAL